MSLRAVALVATGGFLGATTRYAADTAFSPLVSTFVVNVFGCFALGYLLYVYRLDGVSEEVRLLAAAGFLSSLTTYSTFAHEIFTSTPSVALGYVVASYGVGFSATYAGARLGTRGRKG